MTLTSEHPDVARQVTRAGLPTVWAMVGWGVSRAVLALLMRAPFEGAALSDIATFYDWASDAWHRSLVPGRDFPWEYPPGALPFVLLPAVDHGPWGYLMVFASLMVVVDGLFFVYVLRASGPRSRSVLLWLLGPLLLGPLFLERFDVAAAVLAAAGLALLRRRPAASAALITLAASVKLWPAVLLGLFPAGSALRKAARAAAGCAVAVVAISAATGVLPAFWSAISQQRDRGLQVEAVAATPFLLSPAHPVYRHSSWEIPGAGADAVGVAVSLLGLMVVAALLVRWHWLAHRAVSVDPTVAGATLTAATLVFDKALSPQYLVWLLACVTVAAAHPFLHARWVTWLTLLTCALTQGVYPLQYTPLLHGAVEPGVLLLARNTGLVIITGLLVHATCFPHPSRLHRGRV